MAKVTRWLPHLATKGHQRSWSDGRVSLSVYLIVFLNPKAGWYLEKEHPQKLSETDGNKHKDKTSFLGIEH